jgi:hypothetical protein
VASRPDAIADVNINWCLSAFRHWAFPVSPEAARLGTPRAGSLRYGGRLEQYVLAGQEQKVLTTQKKWGCS